MGIEERNRHIGQIAGGFVVVSTLAWVTSYAFLTPGLLAGRIVSQLENGRQTRMNGPHTIPRAGDNYTFALTHDFIVLTDAPSDDETLFGVLHQLFQWPVGVISCERVRKRRINDAGFFSFVDLDDEYFGVMESYYSGKEGWRIDEAHRRGEFIERYPRIDYTYRCQTTRGWRAMVLTFIMSHGEWEIGMVQSGAWE